MHRRQFLATSAACGFATQLGNHHLASNVLAKDAGLSTPAPGKAEHVIFIWLGGGMAQIDTFDPKRRGSSAERKPGSDYEAIDTAVQGVQVCQHLRRTAERMDRVTAVRTVHHETIDEHAAAVYWVHVGRPVNGTVQYPALGASVAHELGPASDDAPAYAVIGYPNMSRSPGFLGPKYGYLYLTDLESGPRGLMRPDYVDAERHARRMQLLNSVRDSGLQRIAHSAELKRYDQALAENLRLSGKQFMDVFDLNREASSTRDSYGNEFGQRCLLARRLTESGVRFVEVSHNLNFVNGTGWDTHKEGQQNQWTLIEELDQALAALIDDLEHRQRLDKTLIVVGTEFGRPAEFDGAGGRGHQSKTFSMVLAGGGLNHQGAVGLTDELAKTIVERPVSIPDFHATVYHTLGIDFRTELYDGNRPVPITDGGKPIAELFV
ncbi:MAG: DUF1501 domain-containing protein [Planctomycetales bacterium]|nr:DUF1501 domain-containing protein [Planctomycetales bacterium]